MASGLCERRQKKWRHASRLNVAGKAEVELTCIRKKTMETQNFISFVLTLFWFYVSPLCASLLCRKWGQIISCKIHTLIYWVEKLIERRLIFRSSLNLISIGSISRGSQIVHLKKAIVKPPSGIAVQIHSLSLIHHQSVVTKSISVYQQNIQ